LDAEYRPVKTRITMNEQTILIVDDDKEIVQSLKKNILAINKNYTVKTSHDGKNALEILEKEEIDFLILDLQMPVMNGLQLLAELHIKKIWLPIIIISDTKVNEEKKEFKEFGVIDFVKKPFLPERMVINIDEMMRNRGKTDLIKNFGLPAMMQLIEMEKKTGILTVKIGKENGKIFFKEGKLMDIEVKELSTGEALKECINSLYDEKEISIEYINHRKEKKINMTLMEMVMEASRIRDEKKRSPEHTTALDQNREISESDHLSIIANLLHSLREVERFIIADAKGEILTASSNNYNEDILNASIYLWVIGARFGNEFKMGEPANLIYYLKARKRLIYKYNDYIIILDLTEIAKFSAFKKKLNELFNRLVLN